MFILVELANNPKELPEAACQEVNETKPLRVGDVCPKCGQGKLDYDGTLMLACPICGYMLGEGGGCT